MDTWLAHAAAMVFGFQRPTFTFWIVTGYAATFVAILVLLGMVFG